MATKCLKCAAERKNITANTVNVKVCGLDLGSSTTYRCKLCGHKWKEKTNEVTAWRKSGQ